MNICNGNDPNLKYPWNEQNFLYDTPTPEHALVLDNSQYYNDPYYYTNTWSNHVPFVADEIPQNIEQSFFAPQPPLQVPQEPSVLPHRVFEHSTSEATIPGEEKRVRKESTRYAGYTV